MKTPSRLSRSIHSLLLRLTQGPAAYAVAIVWLAIGVTLVYISPRSLIAFLIFLSSALLIYYLKLSNRAKLSLAILVTLVLLPVVGVRNIFYLEVAFQISVYAALALGLNIVVGFAGLLDLGYVAFYAVGAYLWAFFGSQQPSLLHAIPGTAPPGAYFLLPGNMFYLFVILGLAVARSPALCWACRCFAYGATIWRSSPSASAKSSACWPTTWTSRST